VRLVSSSDVHNFIERRRRSTGVSCEACSKDRAECDHDQPCGRCRNLDQSCVYKPGLNRPSANEVRETEIRDASHVAVGTSNDVTQSTAAPLSNVNTGESLTNDPLQWSGDNSPGMNNISMWTQQSEAQSFFISPDSPSNWVWREDRFEDTPSLEFLLRFTSTTGLANAFECGTVEQRRHVLEHASCGGVSSNPHLTHVTADESMANPFEPNEHVWNYMLDQPLFTHGFGLPTTTDNLATVTHDWMTNTPPNNMASLADSRSADAGSSQQDPDMRVLETVSIRIRSKIREVTEAKPKNSVVNLTWSPEVESKCAVFFSAFNLRKYLALYWAGWHPNNPLMHKPTFDLAQTSDLLISAMALIGKSCLITISNHF
jgi:hypothetical protein